MGTKLRMRAAAFAAASACDERVVFRAGGLDESLFLQDGFDFGICQADIFSGGKH